MRVTQDLLWKTEYLKHSAVEPYVAFPSLEGRTSYERQFISLSKPSMISANAWVESHVAYHSLEGQPQMIGSFITPFQGSLTSATAATRDEVSPGNLYESQTTFWTPMFMYVLDTFIVNLRYNRPGDLWRYRRKCNSMR